MANSQKQKANPRLLVENEVLLDKTRVLLDMAWFFIFIPSTLFLIYWTFLTFLFINKLTPNPSLEKRGADGEMKRVYHETEW